MPHALVFAIGVAVSPVPLASSLVVLGSPRARASGTLYVVGWAAGVLTLAIVVAAVVQAAGAMDSRPAWIAVFEFVVGAAFFLAALALWRREGLDRIPRRPLVSAIHRLTPTRAGILGVALSVANPKVIALTLAAAVSAANEDTSTGATVGSVLLFAAVGTIGVAAPLGAYLAFPSRVSPELARASAWIERHEARVLVPLGLAVSGLFVVDGVRLLS